MTGPDPQAALQALVAKWRRNDESNCDRYLAAVYHECADELEEALAEAALSRPPEPPSHPPQGGQRSDLAEQLAVVRATLEKARTFARGRHSTISYGPMSLVVEIDSALKLLDAVAMMPPASHGSTAAGQAGKSGEAALPSGEGTK
jgi:hypothetical protein